jgi:hypothetical protein
MNKKNWLALLFATTMAFSVGCGETAATSNSSGTSTGEQPVVKNPSYEVWSTYNTMRVVQNPELNGNYEMADAKITAKMAKNELESAQLFITTNDMSFEYFELIAADLTNENGDVLPADQIDVYAQHYVNITQHSPATNIEEYPLGYMPDGLIPMDLSVKYGENIVKENCNQGITVDFISHKDTPAGTYTGNFTLLLDDEEMEIPVELTVWDFALPEDSTCNSCIIIYEDSIRYGEMNTKDDQELYKNYYDVLLRYKLNGMWVPYALKSPEALVNSVLEYWDHPNFQTYGMPHQSFISKAWNGWTKGAEEYYRQAMMKLAYASTEDKILFDKMYFWPVDEPDGGVNGNLGALQEWDAKIQALKKRVEEDLIKEGFFDDKTPEFKEKLLYSLRNIQHVCTTYWKNTDEWYEEGMDITFCPEIHFWERYSEELSMKQDAAEKNNQSWYYTCVSPKTPYPTQFIDDFLITGREMKWMQKYYDLDAWLYWAASQSRRENQGTFLENCVNPYETALRFMVGNIPNGDGYLLLAGARYEQEYPIATQRLLAYREGQDDLDMMNYLEDIYAEYNTYYGLPKETLTFNTVHAGLFDRIFCRSISYRSDSVLDETREIIANTILSALNEEDKFAYTIDYAGNTATYKFYAANGFDIKVGDSVLSGVASGSGKVFTYTVDLTKDSLLSSVVVSSANSSRTITLYDDAGTKAIEVVGDNAITFGVTQGSTVAKGNEEVTFTIKSKGGNSAVEAMRFVPKVSFSLKEEVRTIELDLENTEDETVMMTLVIIGEDGSSCTADIALTANAKHTVEVLNRLADGVKVASIEIRFVNGELNGDEVTLLADRTIKLSGIRIK